MKIIFLVPYPLNEVPSQRFRFEQYFRLLTQNGHRIYVQSFLNTVNWRIFYLTKGVTKKLLALTSSIFKRLVLLFSLSSYDYIFVHREILPFGPPVLEWIISKIFRKKIIYDFDDTIWLTDKKNESSFERSIRWRNKVETICRLSHKVSVGNMYLAEHAGRFQKNIVINPTTIDTIRLHNRKLFENTQSLKNDKITIGWTGSHSTLKYLEILQPILKQVEEKYPHVSFLIIADQPPKLDLKNLVFKVWSKETEIKDLMRIDIGIMPLPDDEWTKGKCGFKALQFMALEIPCIASPVGVNTKIIQHGINGFLCASGHEWLACFDLLITNKVLHNQIGKAGRKTVEENYSVESNSATFLSLFE